MGDERAFDRCPVAPVCSLAMIVLGIDPGTADTGYGVLERRGSRLAALDYGVVRTQAGEPPERRLCAIAERVAELIELHAPAAVALEDLYVGGNPRTILSVGQARGAVLAACGAAGVPASGYPPSAVKLAVCGFGHAGKGQVKHMVRTLLGLAAPPESDHASDALAVAICHAQTVRVPARMAAR
jgi:crossover junction endodeoxyribonuclease RuvC